MKITICFIKNILRPMNGIGVLVVLAVLIFQTHSAAQQSPAMGSATLPMYNSNQSQTPQYVPGQIIVKYKNSVKKSVETSVVHKAAFKNATVDASDSLDKLNQKYKVKKAKPLFPKGRSSSGITLQSKISPMNVAAIKRQESNEINPIKKKFPQRSARAPKDAVVPDLSRVYLIEIDPSADVLEAVKEFATHPDVEYAEPNYTDLKPNFIPTDPRYNEQWALKKIKAESAWDLSQGLNTVVAVVDTGVDYNHPDLAANIWNNSQEALGDKNKDGFPGVKEVDDDGDGLIDEDSSECGSNRWNADGEPCVYTNDLAADDDENGYVDDIRGWAFDDFVGYNDPMDNVPSQYIGHGTNVAGIIAAEGNNQIGVIGLVPRSKVMALKVFKDLGGGQWWSSSDYKVKAFRYAVDNGADVINLSSDTGYFSYVLNDVVKYAYSMGVVVVLAAGNEGLMETKYSPTLALREAMVVGATDINDNGSSFSTPGTDVAVGAPGSDILLTHINNKYRVESGTSYAAPHVSALAALIISKRPQLKIDQIMTVIKASADDIGEAGFDLKTGAGRINARKALDIEIPLDVRIDSPSRYAILDRNANRINITGSATGINFKDYQLFYKPKYSPSSEWKQINGLTLTGVVKNILASWDVSTIFPNDYLVRLSARSTQGIKYEDVIEVHLGKEHSSFRRITSDSKDQINPYLSGDKLVWQDMRNGNWDIYMYDLKTGQERRITTDDKDQVNPVMDGDRIFWLDWRNYTPDPLVRGYLVDIYYYDLRTMMEYKLPLSKRVNGYYPISVSAKGVAYSVARMVGDQIVVPDSYYFDLNTRQEFCLAGYERSCVVETITNPREESYSADIEGTKAIFVSGSNVFEADVVTRIFKLVDSSAGHLSLSQNWLCKGTYVGSVWCLDSSTGIAKWLPTRTGAHPDVSAGFVVWDDWREFNSEIVMFDINNPQQISAERLTENDGHSSNPVVSKSEDKTRIAWQDNRNGNFDIYYVELVKAPVAWGYPLGVTVTGSNLNKTATTGWGNAGAVSAQLIGGDGWFEFEPGSSVTTKIVAGGLSSTNMDNHINSIYYGFVIKPAQVEIYECGLNRKVIIGSSIATDRFRVQRIGQTIYYLKNGTLLYSSTAPSTGNLMADVALYDTGATIANAVIFGVTADQRPAGPSNLNTSVLSASKVGLSWVDHAVNETLYKIERAGGSSETFNTIATLSPNVTSYTDSGIVSGKTYYYRIVASNGAGYSAYSNTASAAIVPPNIPANLKAIALSSSQIGLMWTDSANNETGYKVESAVSVYGPFSVIATLGTNMTTYSDSGLSIGTTKYYRVYAYNVVGNSGFSYTASATIEPIPTAPTALTAGGITTSSIIMGWSDRSNNEAGFRVERASNPSGPFSAIATLGANANSYTNSSLPTGTTYYYRLYAFNASGNSAFSNMVSATTLTLPVAPTNLVMSASTINSISLIWTDNANNEVGYKIERASSINGPFSLVANLSANTAAYTNSGLTSGTTYYYRVYAYNAGGNSGYSNILSATTVPLPPVTPSSLTANGGTAWITLTWTDNANNETGYKVERAASSSGPFTLIATLGANSNSFNNSGILSSATWYYRVYAYNAGGNSGYSNTASGATPPAMVTWVNAVGVAVQWNSIIKTLAANGWNAGAASSKGMTANGYVDIYVDATDKTRSFGLGTSNTSFLNNVFNGYSIQLNAGGKFYVERTLASGTYAVEDRFAVERVGTSILYKKNGTLIATSTVASTGTLYAWGAIFSPGGVLDGGWMGGVEP